MNPRAVHLLGEEGPFPGGAAAASAALAKEYGYRADGIPLLPALVIPWEALPLPGLEAIAPHLAELHDFAPLLSPEGRSDRALLLLQVEWLPRDPGLRAVVFPVVGYHKKNHETLSRALPFEVYRGRVNDFLTALHVLRAGPPGAWLNPLKKTGTPLAPDLEKWQKQLAKAQNPTAWAKCLESASTGDSGFAEALANTRGQLTSLLSAMGQRMAEAGAPPGDLIIRPHLDGELYSDKWSGGFMSADPWSGEGRVQGMLDRDEGTDEERALGDLPPEILSQVEGAAAAFRRHDASVVWAEFAVVGSRLWITGWREVDAVAPRAQWKRLAETVAGGRLTAAEARGRLGAEEVRSLLTPDFQGGMERWGAGRGLVPGRVVGPLLPDLKRLKLRPNPDLDGVLLSRGLDGEVLTALPKLSGLILFGTPPEGHALRILERAGKPVVFVNGPLPEGRKLNLGPITVKPGEVISVGVEKGGGVWLGKDDCHLMSRPLSGDDWRTLVGGGTPGDFRLWPELTKGADVVLAGENLADSWGLLSIPGIMAHGGRDNPYRRFSAAWLLEGDEISARRLEMEWQDLFTRTLSMGEGGPVAALLCDGRGIETPLGLEPSLLRPDWYRLQMRALVQSLTALGRLGNRVRVLVPVSALKQLGTKGLEDMKAMGPALDLGVLWQGDEAEDLFIRGILASDFSGWMAPAVGPDLLAWNTARALRPDHDRVVLGEKDLGAQALADQVRRIRRAGATGAYFPVRDIPLLRWALADEN